MIGVSEWPSASSWERRAPTRPSIMSLGATMSAPALACEIAVLASSSRLMSLSTSPSGRTTPQWPCDVYSHRHTSVMTTSSGCASLIARTASCTTPSSSYAPDPCSSFSAGMPKSRTDGMPSACATPASSTACEIERRSTPGIASIGVRLSVPSSTNRGRTRCAGVSSVSRTIPRRRPVRRSLRIRVAGNAMRSVYGEASKRQPRQHGERGREKRQVKQRAGDPARLAEGRLERVERRLEREGGGDAPDHVVKPGRDRARGHQGEHRDRDGGHEGEQGRGADLARERAHRHAERAEAERPERERCHPEAEPAPGELDEDRQPREEDEPDGEGADGGEDDLL